MMPSDTMIPTVCSELCLMFVWQPSGKSGQRCVGTAVQTALGLISRVNKAVADTSKLASNHYVVLCVAGPPNVGPGAVADLRPDGSDGAAQLQTQEACDSFEALGLEAASSGPSAA